MLRKWLVRNFVLDMRFQFFGKTISMPRASRILFPLFVIVGVIIVTDPLWPMFQWWDIIAMLILAIGIWLGFNFFPFSYFNKWPVTYPELDDEQRWDFINGISLGVIKNPQEVKSKFGFITPLLTEEQKELKKYLEFRLKRVYVGYFKFFIKVNWPILMSIALIVIWYLYLMPYFNPDFVSTNPKFF